MYEFVLITCIESKFQLGCTICLDKDLPNMPKSMPHKNDFERVYA